MIAFVPVLRDFDTRQRDRRFERDQSERCGDSFGEIGRQRRQAVGFRGDDRAGNEARDPQHDIRR